MVSKIIIFYLLYLLKAPAWCWMLNSISVLVLMMSYSIIIGRGISKLNIREDEEIDNREAHKTSGGDNT